MTDPHRFIVITVPPPEVAREIEALRRPLCLLARSFAALAYPPHLTLRTGLLVPEARRTEFLTEFGALLEGIAPFAVRTRGLYLGPYQQDDGPRHILRQEVEPNEKLKALNARLLTYTKYRKSARLAFEPHLTLVFEDLSREGLEELGARVARRREELGRGFAWRCDNVCLYRREGTLWVEYRRWLLTGASKNPRRAEVCQGSCQA